MSSKKTDDKSPRDTDDGRRNEAPTTDNPPMECNPAPTNVQVTENILLPHLETLNLFSSLQPNPTSTTGVVTPGRPRTTPISVDQIPTWLQNIIDHSPSSTTPNVSPTLATDVSDLARRISPDSLTDQRFTPLHIPFANAALSEGIFSNLLIPEVPNLSPLVMSTLRNPVPSSALRRPSWVNTERTVRDDFAFVPHSRIIPNNRAALTASSYTSIFPRLSGISPPRQTPAVLWSPPAYTSRYLTSGRLMTPIGYHGSNTALFTRRVISTAPYQPRLFIFMHSPNARPRVSAAVNPAPRPIIPQIDSSTPRVILRPRRRLCFSSPPNPRKPPSAAPTTSSTEVSREVIPSELSLDEVPTRLDSPTVESPRMQPTEVIIQLPVTETLTLEPTDVPIPENDTTGAPTLQYETDLTQNVPTKLCERKETTETSTVLNEQVPEPDSHIPVSEPEILLNPSVSATQVPTGSNLSIPEREAPLAKETREAVREISRIITITNPNTKEVQEYWVRKTTEMLSEVAGSVNDAAAPVRAPKRGPVKAVVVKKVLRLEKSSKKKNLKGIVRKQANPIDTESSSSELSPRPTVKLMSSQQRDAPPAFDPTKYTPPRGPRYRQIEGAHIRPKRPRKYDNSSSSGYPTFRDEIPISSSSSDSEYFAIDSETTEPDCPQMTLKEKIDKYFANIRKYQGQQNDSDDEAF